MAGLCHPFESDRGTALMSGEEQSAMKREVNAQLNKLRREQRARVERQARRRALAGGLLVVLLLAALGVTLWRQLRLRDLDQTERGARHERTM